MHVGKITVKNEIRPFAQAMARDFPQRVLWIEKAKFHFFRVLAEDGEVGAFTVPGGAERVRITLPETEYVHVW